MVALEMPDELSNELERLARALGAIEIGPGHIDLVAERDSVIQAVRGYLMPRAADPQMPLVVVFAGPTGSGKSTLVNSLAGRILTETGSVRPTTRGPIALVGNHTEGLIIGREEVAAVHGSAPILQTMTLVDTPDIDSTRTDHRKTAENLIDHADIVVFVTSALRYADEAPWQVLRRAVSRGATVINVLNRVTAETGGAVVDFKARLNAVGLDGTLLTVSEHHIDIDQQRVPSLAVRSLSRRLAETGVSKDAAGRAVFERVHMSVVDRVLRLADDLDEIRHDLASFEAEIDIALAARSSKLKWPTEVSVTFPKDGRRRSVRRWQKKSVDAVSEVHVQMLCAAVQSDLLVWASEQRHEVLDDNEIREVVADSMPVITSAVEGWRAGIVDIVNAHDADDWVRTARTDLSRRVDVVAGYLRERLVELVGTRLEVSAGSMLRDAMAAPIDA